MADNVPWSNDTNPFITDLDNSVAKKYDVSLRRLFLNPEEYEGVKDISDRIGKVRADVEAYFTDLEEGLEDERKEFTKDLEDADALYTKMEQAVSSKAAIAKVPYFKPADSDLSRIGSEIMYLDDYNNTLDAIILRLINSSEYVANVSTVYKKYNIGAWFFSGERPRILSVNPPQSVLISIEAAHDEISDMLEAAAGRLAPAAPAKPAASSKTK